MGVDLVKIKENSIDETTNETSKESVITEEEQKESLETDNTNEISEEVSNTALRYFS